MTTALLRRSTFVLVVIAVALVGRSGSIHRKSRRHGRLHGSSFLSNSGHATKNSLIPSGWRELGLEELLPLRTRLRLELGDIGDPVRFLVEFQDSRGFYDEDKLFVTSRHINENDFLQVQIQLNSDDFLGGGTRESALPPGRFTLDLGKRRLSARNRMRNTTNAFDGVYWSLGTVSSWTIQTFVTRPVVIDPEKLDSSSSSR